MVEFREKVDVESVELATELEIDVTIAEVCTKGVEMGVSEVSDG